MVNHSNSGFGRLPCPRCGEEASIDLRLEDLETFYCRECENEFTRADVRKIIERWGAVLAWLEKVPLPSDREL